MALRKISTPVRRASASSNSPNITSQPELSEGEYQKLLREAQPGMSYDKLVKFTRLTDIGTAGIFENAAGERAIFAIDKASREVIWIEDIDPAPALVAAPVLAATETFTTPSAQENAEEDHLHPVARAYKLLSETEQKKYWQNINYLTVPYGPDRNITCKLIGYQNLDSGPIGAIFGDEHNARHLFCVSYKTGAPFRLGQPRPPKRP